MKSGREKKMKRLIKVTNLFIILLGLTFLMVPQVRAEGPEAKVYTWENVQQVWPAPFAGKIGIRVISGDFTTLLLADDKKGAIVNDPGHYHEQTSYVVKGKALFRSGGKETILNAGDIVIIPPYVPHYIEFLEDSLLVEVFSPSRKELLPKK
jgi:quercetin dioxygenase-like cupin family protein